MSAPQFLGEWYVMRAFDPDVSCLVFNYTTCGEGCLRVVETKKIDLIDSIGISNVYQTEGTLKIDGSEPSEMKASFTTSMWKARHMPSRNVTKTKRLLSLWLSVCRPLCILGVRK